MPLFAGLSQLQPATSTRSTVVGSAPVGGLYATDIVKIVSSSFRCGSITSPPCSAFTHSVNAAAAVGLTYWVTSDHTTWEESVPDFALQSPWYIESASP